MFFLYDKCKLKNCLPIRFTQIINKNIYENSNKIGVFLLTGGDILIAKDGCIELIRRLLPLFCCYCNEYRLHFYSSDKAIIAFFFKF